MKATFLELASQFHWTLASIVLGLLAMFVVEAFRIMGRASDPKVPREAFSAGRYFGQFINWFSPIVSVVCLLLLLAIRDWMVESVGLVIKDAGSFELFFAFGAGGFGQSMVKTALKAFMGMFGAFGRSDS